MQTLCSPYFPLCGVVSPVPFVAILNRWQKFFSPTGYG